MSNVVKGRLTARNSGSPAIIRGTYAYEVILSHPKTKAVTKRFRESNKDFAYTYADVLASASVVVDVKRVRVKVATK